MNGMGNRFVRHKSVIYKNVQLVICLLKTSMQESFGDKDGAMLM